MQCATRTCSITFFSRSDSVPGFTPSSHGRHQLHILKAQCLGGKSGAVASENTSCIGCSRFSELAGTVGWSRNCDANSNSACSNAALGSFDCEHGMQRTLHCQVGSLSFSLSCTIFVGSPGPRGTESSSGCCSLFDAVLFASCLGFFEGRP